MLDTAAPNASRYLAAFADGLRPSEIVTVSAAVEEHRQLDAVSSSKPGPYRGEKMPHLAEIQDCLGSEHPAELVVAMMASQTGKSTVLLNWLYYTIKHDPCPFLLVQPDVERSEDFSKGRVAPMIEECPDLRALVSDAKARTSSNTVHSKLFPGGKLIMVGANSPAGLASNPIRRVAMDELDRFKPSAGGEGSPISLAEKRTASFSNRKIFLCSSPTVDGNGTIWKQWLRSDQRHRMVPCPHCGKYIELEWEQLHWKAGERESVYYECQECGCEIYERDKPKMLGAGRWQAFNPGSEIPGFTVSYLYLPLGWHSWWDGIRKYEEALESGDPELMRTFLNTWLCRVFDDKEDYAPPDGWAEGRAEQWRARCPAGVGILVAGVDVQDDRIECEVVGYGKGQESWSVDFSIFPGDPNDGAVWSDLDAHLDKLWSAEVGPPLKVQACCVDSGGHRTTSALKYCSTRIDRRVYGIMGSRNRDAIMWPGKWKKSGSRYPYWEVGVNAIKDRVIPWLHLKPYLDADGKVKGYPAGFCHVPEGRGSEWFAQMRSEIKQIVIKGARNVAVWTKVRRRNEALDCRVYAYAALQSLILAGHTIERALDLRQPKSQTDNAVVPKPAPRASHMSRFRNGGQW